MNGQGLLERILNDQLIVNGMLAVIAVCSLTFAYRHLRPLARRPHVAAHSGGPAAVGGGRAGGDPWMSPPPRVAGGYPSRPGHQEPSGPVAVPVPGALWGAGSVQLATWILDEANAQAAEIRHEARDEAAASLADARKEAAELLRQARDQAAAKLAAAELEAAQVQAAVLTLSSKLGEAAAQVTMRQPVA
jgi:hypothetical protein